MWNTVIDAYARRTVLVLWLLVGAAAPVLASSVREVTLDEMLGRAAFVLEGQALVSRVEFPAQVAVSDGAGIESCVGYR